MTQSCSVKKIRIHSLLKAQLTVQMVGGCTRNHIGVADSYCNELLTLVHVHIHIHTFLVTVVVIIVLGRYQGCGDRCTWTVSGLW